MRITYPLGVLAGLLALSACGKKPHEEPMENDVVVNEVENITEPAPLPPELPAENESARPVENRLAPPEISEEQQMQDDAEATGMTSRLPDDESTSSTAGGASR